MHLLDLRELSLKVFNSFMRSQVMDDGCAEADDGAPFRIRSFL